MFKPALPTVARSATLSDVAEGILDVVAQLLDTRLAVVSRIESTTYTIMAVVDQHHAIQPGQIYDLSDTFCMQMLETGQPLCINDTRHAPASLGAIPNALELNIRSYLGVPLSMADGRVFGSLWAADTTARKFSDHDVALLQLFARLLTHEIDQAAETRHNERIEQVMSMQPNIDPLTGLMTRDSFAATLAREAVRRSRFGGVYAVAVLVIDHTDTGRDRNDAHTLDAVRQGLADMLMRTSRLVDCCARVDNDAFAVLFLETSAGGVSAWRERIEAAIDAWNRMHATSELALSVNIGIADCHDTPNWTNRSTEMLDLAQQRAQGMLVQH